TVNASGSYQPTVTVSNGVDSAGGTFLWTVNPAPPASPVTVINPGTQNSTTGSPVSLALHAYKTGGGGPLTDSATGLPNGLGINAKSGVISGTVSAAAASNGPFTTTVTASDGVNSGQQTFVWNVSDPVTIVNPGIQTSTEGQAVSLQVQASDTAGG